MCSFSKRLCVLGLQGGSWECLKTMEGHKGEVNAVSVHPSGSAALSVGRWVNVTLLPPRM